MNKQQIINLIFLTGILALICIALTGCNKQIIDLDYSYNKVYCNYDGDKFELKIDKWNDYDGEQIQVKSGKKTYLLSANKCYLVKE